MDLNVAPAERETGSDDEPWELPAGWCWTTLETVLPIAYGKALPERDRQSHGQVPVMGSSGIVGQHNSHLAPANSIIVGRKGSAGSVFFSTAPSWPIDTAYFTVGTTAVDLRYGYRFLQYSKLGHLDQSTAIPSLSRDRYNVQAFPLAPLPEQRRIVERIDSLFAEIAEGEAALEDARKGLETFRRALLKSAVTGELTRDWRQTNQPNETGHDLLARIKGERDATPKSGRGKKATASPSLDKSDLPELPEGWAWARLGQLLSHLTSGSRDWAEYYDKGSKVFVMAQNVRPGRFNHAYTKHVDPPEHLKDVERSRIQRDDLLITIVGANTGDVCRVNFEATDFFVCQSVALMRPALAELSQYLEMYLIAPDGGRRDMQKVIYGAGRPHLSFDQIEALPIPIPPAAEMLEILGRTSGLLSAYSDTLMMLEAETADAARLRQAVLKAAFEGKLVPQDPADEPASGLLSRLKAQESANLKQTKRRKKV